MIRYTIKFVLLMTVILGYVVSSLIMGYLTREEYTRRRRLSANICRWAKIGVKIFGIRVDARNKPDQDVFRDKNFLVVCNHLSYTDIIVLASIFPSVFVTSVEIRDSAFLGLMSALGGTLFIERRSRENIDNEIAEIAAALKARLNIVIFPEATSSNGETVLPFKRSLLKAAIDAQVNVLPIAISYPWVNGHRASAEEREQICWYGAKEFFPHLKAFLSLRSITARLDFMPELNINEMPDRKAIAERAYEQIYHAYTRENALERTPS